MADPAKPKIVYANSFSITSGLWSMKPIECRLRQNNSGHCWSDATGDAIIVHKLGACFSSDKQTVTYASKLIEEVYGWTEGVKSSLSLIRQITEVPTHDD
jgi:hypothetical protein